MTALATALDYIRRGLAPVPVPYRRKGPILDNWSKLRIGEDEAPRYFVLRHRNGTP